jgi:hypothetical protein
MSDESNHVLIFDTTLRDGEQAPGFSMRITEKLRLARQLERLGVDVVEAGFPAASAGERESVRAVAGEVGCGVAALCRTRKQLVAVSNLVILSISALGGSMFPRFLMPEGLKKLSLVAFNSWALEGFLDVLWRDLGPAAVLPEIAVLLGWSALFFVLARRLARRWELA